MCASRQNSLSFSLLKRHFTFYACILRHGNKVDNTLVNYEREGNGEETMGLIYQKGYTNICLLIVVYTSVPFSTPSSFNAVQRFIRASTKWPISQAAMCHILPSVPSLVLLWHQGSYKLLEVFEVLEFGCLKFKYWKTLKMAIFFLSCGA